MYKKLKNTTVEKVGTEDTGGEYICHIPPVGYGYNIISGTLEKVDVIKRSDLRNEQYWERLPLPNTYAAKRKKEEVKELIDEDYYDEELENIRQIHWNRRLNGCWVYIDGNPVYITGLHWFYINWWQIDIGYPDYRDSDRKFFYVLMYCYLDPDCCGLMESTKRRQGKTFRGACLLYEVISRTKNSEGGIQSKTATDARDVVFKRALVSPFKKLPHFFIPVFDTSKGITPTSELKFAHTTKKGKKALDDLDKPELNSLIDWAASEEFAYDGRKKRIMFNDEEGKTLNVNVADRHNVVKYCLETDGTYTGFKLASTTVEEMESGGKEFKQLWDESDKKERNENNRTKTGMYRYMTPAYETLFYDKFGMPNVNKAMSYYMNTRNGLADNPRTLSSEIRKNPFNQMEMFRIDGTSSHYDPMLLNERLDNLWQENITTRGDFIWENGNQDTTVIFVANKNGKYEICWNFKTKEESNKVIRKGNNFYPDNSTKFVIGADPFSHNKTVDSRRSDGAALVLRKFDAVEANDDFNNCFVVKYKARPAAASIYYEDMIKLCVYFGCQILFENNKNNWDIYFKQRGYEAFLMQLDGYPDYGIPGNENTCRQLVEVTEEYINKSINKVYFRDLIEGWLKFDMADTTKFDLPMAAGYTLIADLRKIYKRQQGNLRPITDYLKKFKIG